MIKRYTLDEFGIMACHDKDGFVALSDIKKYALNAWVRFYDHEQDKAAAVRELIQALEDLSFECYGFVSTRAPSAETYNRTFDVLEKHRRALAEAEK